MLTVYCCVQHENVNEIIYMHGLFIILTLSALTFRKATQQFTFRKTEITELKPPKIVHILLVVLVFFTFSSLTVL